MPLEVNELVLIRNLIKDRPTPQDYCSAPKTFYTFFVVYGKEKSTIIKVTTKLRLENMGAGILNIAFFLSWIKLLEKDKFLLIEEPELFIYPGLQTKLLEKFLVVSNQIQIFITTHSKKFLINNDKLGSVFLIQKLNNETIVSLIPKEDYPQIYENMEDLVEEYEQERKDFYSEKFWIDFINKAMQREEDQLWDFKETLDWWNPECTIKEQKQVEFCENVAAFANVLGGILIIGITDKRPRVIKGIQQIEKRKISIIDTLNRLTNIDFTDCILREIPLSIKNHKEQWCLGITIPQTKKVIEVRQLNKSISYPIRVGVKKEYSNHNKILEAKREVYKNNFKFKDKLIEFTYS